ncbi:hypothetical protein [Wohlfahrtiimonas chitiniclastica]|uniref:hypothetical protein n=1 Tax=Wohlfahrtiimonas chitiniclastica TaxID=400946 RepID=UPI000B98ECC3|nr:hypothetical protein [Wohlfahrtiimonas chitiniclastica]OYQ85123.1 hypothetical protein B9T14_01195 [Wohlfahrtiimonas chitiniclastica]OYQ86643.1 hypothetical protein B9T15_03845 [Wohlfahrtiimonas chitiniclastica]
MKTDSSIDMKNRLTITISNDNPVSLVDLTDSLMGIADQYYDYIANDSKGESKGVLYVSEIRKGSMVFELVAEVLPYVPLFAATTTPLESWVNQFVSTVRWLQGIGKKPEIDFKKKDLNNMAKTFSTVANDGSSAITFNLEGANINNFNSVIYTSEDAEKITKRAKDEAKLIEDKGSRTLSNRLMVWDQTKFNLKTTTGDKALIESIYDKPIKIIFQNESDKAYMYNAGKYFNGIPWQELGFIIDVEVQYSNGKPRLYNVLNVHTEETFVLNDDE